MVSAVLQIVIVFNLSCKSQQVTYHKN